MNILFIHNRYGKYSGEEAVVESQVKLLEDMGHRVVTYYRNSSGIANRLDSKIKAFFAALYNPKAIKGIREIILKEKPDIVHVHNLYPFISPAVLPEIKKMGIPIVMTVHNYRLICPNGLCFSKGEICERCFMAREGNCIIRNCEDSLFKSTGYALRNAYSRIKGYYSDNVDVYSCLTEFQKSKLVDNGFEPDKCVVIPNCYNGEFKKGNKNTVGDYVCFAGRISKEKGIHLLMEAAGYLKDVQIKLAGDYDNEYFRSLNVPKNVEFVGKLDKNDLADFYNNARFFVLPSICYEGFPMVFPEAMNHNLPIVAPDMAGYPEVVGHGSEGLLFKPGNALDLAYKIEELWQDTENCMDMGNNAYRKMVSEYGPMTYYKSHMQMYKKLLADK